MNNKRNDIIFAVAIVLVLYFMFPLASKNISKTTEKTIDAYLPVSAEPAEPDTEPIDPLPPAPVETQPEPTAAPAPVETQPEPTAAPASASPTPASSTFVHSDASYFDDALFIGDSRTDDIRKYGTLKNATYFAKVGMSVYNIDKKPTAVEGKGEIYLNELLSKNDYGKIYIMLGYNEIGYNMTKTTNKIGELIDRVKAAEPNAVIYLQANLRITKKFSDKGTEATNSQIDALNERISTLADNKTVFYLDVNQSSTFCEDGALRAELTGDGAHLYAKHYKLWCDWLCDHTVQR